MALVAYKTQIKFPIFSIKEIESFQIATSLPILQPSTLVGALAYAYAVYNGLDADTAYTSVKDNIILARARLPQELLVIPSPIMLWRFRILDRGFEKPKRKGGGTTLVMELINQLKAKNYARAKEVVETKLKDALYREYVFALQLEAIWILKREIPKEIFYLINRIGDTESLCSVINVEKVACKEEKLSSVETYYPFVYDVKTIEDFEGNYYTIMKMTDEKGKLNAYVVPLGKDIRDIGKGKKCIVFCSSKIFVKFKTPIIVYRVNNEYLF